MNHQPPDVAVIGTGYVGLTTAVCLAHLGRNVVAVDIDEDKIGRLRLGEVPILEQGLDELLTEGLQNGRLRFSTSYQHAAEAPTVVLCLPTPSQSDGGLDLSYLEQAATKLSQILQTGAVVAIKSTVPIGTNQKLSKWLAREDVQVVSNPEFLREGTALSDFLYPDRIVIGAQQASAATQIADLYVGIDGPIQLTDPTSAEVIKYASNTFLAAKLSFVNELSRLCDHLGGNIEAVTEGLGSDHRIGSAFLTPGPGWGGSCFPKDTLGLAHVARMAGLKLPVVEAARTSNEIHQQYVIAEIGRIVQRPLEQARVGVWGATFKAGTDDTRDSPALEIMAELNRLGASVTVYDPAARPAEIPAETAGDPYTVCMGADLLVVLTEWPEFATVDLAKVAGTMREPLLYDTRYVIDNAKAAKAGIALVQPGRMPSTS